LINSLNNVGPRPLGGDGGEGEQDNWYPDVNSDGYLSAVDVLSVINELNRRNAGSGEGEGAEGEGDLSEMYGLSSVMAGASLSSTPATTASARNYTELRLGDYLHLSHAVPGPVTSAAAWWDETEMASENLIDELSGAYASEFADSHDELFANLDLEL
jgi:hypothetical protein